MHNHEDTDPHTRCEWFALRLLFPLEVVSASRAHSEGDRRLNIVSRQQRFIYTSSHTV
jgi:hypothetical protein